MSKILKSLIVALLVFSFLLYFFYNRSIGYVNKNGNGPVNFVIEKGESLNSISEKLFEKSLISSKLYFKIYLWENKFDKKLQAGDYVLNQGMTMKEIVYYFISGEVVSKEKDVKIIEGWNIYEIAESFDKNNIVNSDEFLNLVKAPVSNWSLGFEKPSFLNSAPAGSNLEGYVYPDTYRVYENASSEDILQKALKNFEQKINNDVKILIENSGKNLHEIITLASIIEKEVQEDKDKQLVAGILLKRMQIGMRLEVDSTINYITGKNDPSASYIDLKIDSPYNTYKNYGLPPGPICNPSLSSIMAAVNPIESDYLFYLNRQDTLETIFSKDYDEHLRNKNKYLK